jgi:F-type H+-transporting ATPase subunit delta
MRNAAIARVYAEALLEMAREKGEMDAVLGDLQEIKADLSAAPDLLGWLASPELSMSHKQHLLERITEGARSPLTLRFLLVLVGKRRALVLPSVLEMVDRLRDEEMGRQRGRVVSARPMSEVERLRLEDVVSRAEGATVTLEAESDPSLIAGMVLHLEDKTVDGSLKTRLARLRERLLTAELRKE